jgi:CDP-glucose 4,6-dehydratase
MEGLAVGRLPDPSFWRRQRVFLTGHTGFKGTWLALWLEMMGAEVCGYSHAPETTPNLFDNIQPVAGMRSEIGDIRDLEDLRRVVRDFGPTVALHMAAQPLVRRSYRNPVETMAENVMGTANVLEALRSAAELRAIVVITTDKVYRNLETGRAFVEIDPLGGHDPYSASKAAAEIVTSSWSQSFFQEKGVAVATARAGNVVGGGDWSEDRLIPDIWRANQKGEPLVLRYPRSTRPWEHVLEPLCGYLLFAEALTERRPALPDALNFGPPPEDELPVAQVADFVASALGAEVGWVPAENVEFVEMRTLALDARLATQTLGWRPRLNTRQALEWTAAWYKDFDQGGNPRELVERQISRYISETE